MDETGETPYRTETSFEGLVCRVLIVPTRRAQRAAGGAKDGGRWEARPQAFYRGDWGPMPEHRDRSFDTKLEALASGMKTLDWIREQAAAVELVPRGELDANI